MQSAHGGDIYRNQVNMDFSVNVNPFGIPKGVEAALHDAVKSCTGYPDPAAEALKDKLAKALSVPKDFLLFGNGASELLMAAVHALKPQKILIPVPSFSGYEYAAEAVSAKTLFFPLREEEAFAFTDDFFHALTEDVDLLFLANPNNPTGRVILPDRLLRILQLCRERHITVVLDECFLAFCQGAKSALPLLMQYPNLLLLCAFTKIFAIPGVRLGYLLSADSDMINRIGGQLPEWNLSLLAQEAGIACMGETEYLQKTAEYIKQERAYLEEALRGLGIRVFPGDANFLLLYTEAPLYELLLQRKILIRDCESFRGLKKGYYRIAVKTRAENEMLWKAIGECIEQDRTAAAGGN